MCQQGKHLTTGSRFLTAVLKPVFYRLVEHFRANVSNAFNIIVEISRFNHTKITKNWISLDEHRLPQNVIGHFEKWGTGWCVWSRGRQRLVIMLDLFILGKSPKVDLVNVKQLATEGSTTQWLPFELSEIRRLYDRKATKWNGLNDGAS